MYSPVFVTCSCFVFLPDFPFFLLFFVSQEGGTFLKGQWASLNDSRYLGYGVRAEALLTPSFCCGICKLVYNKAVVELLRRMTWKSPL
jgi:hypothetical protein